MLFEGSESLIISLTPLSPHESRIQVVGGNATISIQDNDSEFYVFKCNVNFYYFSNFLRQVSLFNSLNIHFNSTFVDVTVAFQLTNIAVPEGQRSVLLTILVEGESERAFPLRVFTVNETAQPGEHSS